MPVVNVFSTLPNNCTELLNCFCCGPTSDKSLGTLFILSLNKTAFEINDPVGISGKNGVSVAAGSWYG